MPSENAVSCDVVILTALSVEFQAVCAHLTDRRPYADPEGTSYELGRFLVGAKSLDVAVTETGEHNDVAAAATEHAIGYLHPRAVMFVGVAGGLKDVKLHDVVAATKVYGYESGKVEGGLKPRPQTGKSTHRMEQRSRAVTHKTAWHARICPMCPDPPPRAFVGPIASGEKVVADIKADLYQFLRQQYSGALCVEMEGVGFLEAASRHRHVEALLVRGISDLIADKEESDSHGSQDVASAHAAAFAFEVLATVELPPRVEPPRRAAIWNIPHLKNPNFTGREELLRNLRESLAAGRTTALTQAIHGLGGVGKTQLAAEYAYRFKNEYDIVWWVRCEEKGVLASDYASLAQKLGLPEKDEADQRVICGAVREWLRTHSGWLLIFDNVVKPEDIHDYIPQDPTGYIIVTSRWSTWRRVAHPLSVEVWPRNESIAFLARRTEEDDGENAGKLADLLGDLPLALEQAAAYIEESGGSLAEYLDLFRNRARELLKKGKPPTDYHDIVATTWDISLRAVEKRCPAAIDLLDLCAFFAPDDIPLDVVRDGAERLPDSLAAVVTDEIKLNDALAALRSYSLVEGDSGSISIHRLVQAVILDRLSDEEQKTWAEFAVRVASKAFPFDSDDVRTWPECARTLPHALAAAGHSERLGIASDATGRVLNQAGLYLWGRAQFSEARELHERAVTQHQAFYGEDHTEVAVVLNNLGLILQDMGDLAGAKEYAERALAIGEKALGPDHPTVGIRLNNLGQILQAMGDLPGAKQYAERALAIGEKAYEPNHPQLASYSSNLATILWAMCDLPGAKEYTERALAIDEKALGPDHPNVAIRLSNLGQILQDMGDLPGGRKHTERALAIGEKAYGPDHPHVASYSNNLGQILQAMGDLSGAKKHAERALAIKRASLGDDHPSTALTQRNLEILLAEIALKRKGKRK